MSSQGRVLITGADGYLGSLLAAKYLHETDDSLVLWVRAGGREEFAAKRARLETRFAGHLARIQLAAGDLNDEQPFAAVCSDPIRSILHAAAVTRFNVEEDLADRVNVEGTRRMLEFARGCPRLSRYGQVSTVYSAGLTDGVIAETAVDPAGQFANHYERSKCAAERILQSQFDELPWHIYRSATIIADSDAGDVTQFNVFHNTMRLIFNGLISLIPSMPKAPLYFITGQFAGDVIFHLMRSAEPERRIYHLCHERPAAVDMETLIDIAFRGFAGDQGFEKRRILKPLFTDEAAFESLASVLSAGLGGAVVRQALDSMRPFSKQLYTSKEFQNTNMREAYPGYARPESARLIEAVIDFLIRTRWGRVSG